MQATRHRSRLVRTFIVALGASALLLTTPGLASAGSRHRGGHGPRVYDHGPTCGYGDSHRRGHRGHHRRSWGHNSYRSHWGHSGDHTRTRQVRRDYGYTCGPCNRRFGSRHDFHRHLHGVHHVPLWRLPFVIVHSAVGWIFHGY